MTAGELLLEGVELMLLGMGIVFLFLVLLVIVIRGMSYLVERFFPPTVSVPVVPVANRTQEPSADVLAAIQSAIHQHRARRG